MQDVFNELLKRKKVSTAEVSRGTGIPYSTLNEWRKGKTQNISQDNLRKIAEYFDIAPWAFYGSVDDLWMYLEGKPVFDVAAGQGRINSDYSGEYIKTDEEDSYLRVHGDSMFPELRDGDTVKVVETSDVCPNDFAIVRIDGEALTIKHVEWTDAGLWLRAENKEVFPDRFYTAKEISTLPVQVIGKAVEVRRSL